MNSEVPNQDLTTHGVMPPLDIGARPLSFFEFWPTKLFYFPIAIYWTYLAIRYHSATLPTLVNPCFPVGGLVGDSKSDILSEISPVNCDRVPPFVTLLKTQNSADNERKIQMAVRRIKEGGLGFPIVAKPDIGCRGFGVKLLDTPQDLRTYVEEFPSDAKIVLQQLVDYEGEAGVFYVREPGAREGRILSLTLKYFPYICGDGHSTIEHLIKNDPRARKISDVYLKRHHGRLQEILAPGEQLRLSFAGSHTMGTIFKNGNVFITEDMRKAFDEIANAIPEFHFGRLDVRFPTLGDLQSGGEFKILEINGAGAEMTHIWDSRTTLREAYAALLNQFYLLYKIGDQNRARGYKPSTPWSLFKAYLIEKRLMKLYPHAD